MSLSSFTLLFNPKQWLKAWEVANIEHKIWAFSVKFDDMQSMKSRLGRLSCDDILDDWPHLYRAMCSIHWSHESRARWLIRYISGYSIYHWEEVSGQLEFNRVIREVGPVLL